MAKNHSQARSNPLKRDEQKSVGVNFDFEDLLVAAIVTVVIKRPKKRTFISIRRP